MNLARRSVIQGSQTACRFSKRKEESLSHLFFECNPAVQVRAGCLKWWGLQTAFHIDCKTHFLQFYGLLIGGKDCKAKWQVTWFSIIWTTRNQCIFNVGKIDKDLNFEFVKLKSWSWINIRLEDFKYSITDWFLNLGACLSLVLR